MLLRHAVNTNKTNVLELMAMTHSSGKRVDHYEILRPLGHGGMSNVFLASDLTNQQEGVALRSDTPTIEEYVLADSQSLKIEIYYKEYNRWIYDAFEDNEEVMLNSLGVHFPLSDAYIDVEFDDSKVEED